MKSIRISLLFVSFLLCLLARARVRGIELDVKDTVTLNGLISLSTCDNIHLRVRAVETLAFIRRSKALSALIRACSDAHPFVRQAAARGLGRRKEKEAAAHLLKLLEDNHTPVRLSAARSIAATENNHMIKRIAPMIFTLPPATAAELAALYFTGMKKEADMSVVKKALSSEVPVLQKAAVVWIGNQTASSLRSRVAELLSSPHIPLRGEVLVTLGKLGNARDFALLKTHSKSGHYLIRRCCARGCGYLNTKESRQVIIALASDKDYTIREAAAKSLEKAPVREALVPLIALLEDEIIEVRHRAAISLAALNPPNLGKDLDRCLTSNRSEVRKEAVFALGNSDNRKWEPLLIQSLTDSCADVVVESVLGLDNIGSARCHAPLVTHGLSHSSWKVRMNAARTLGNHKAVTVVSALPPLLEDKKSEVGVAAIKAIRRIHSPKVAAAVLKQSRKYNRISGTIREHCYLYLGEINFRNAIPVFYQVMNEKIIAVPQAPNEHDSPACRAAAARALELMKADDAQSLKQLELLYNTGPYKAKKASARALKTLTGKEYAVQEEYTWKSYFLESIVPFRPPGSKKR